MPIYDPRPQTQIALPIVGPSITVNGIEIQPDVDTVGTRLVLILKYKVNGIWRIFGTTENPGVSD
jgi:hypothetical protein